MNKDLAKAIRESLFPYIHEYLDVRFIYGGEQLKVFLKDESNRRTCETLLAHYRDQFSRIDLVCHDGMGSRYFERIDFVGFRRSVSRYIQAAINVLKDWDQSDPIYAFVIAVYPSDRQISYTVNTETAWRSKIELHRNAWGAAGTLHAGPSKYCCAEFTTICPEPDSRAFEDLLGCCDSMTEICREYYDIADLSQQWDKFGQNFERRFTQMAVQALRENLAELERLPVTDDFVAYVEDYTGGGEGIYTMMETVPLQKLEALLPHYFSRQ